MNWFILISLIGFITNVNSFPRELRVDIPTCPPTGDPFYAPHQDCSKYYLCDNGNLITGDCPGNLYWNQAILACDFPYNVEDCVGGTREPGDLTTVAITTQDPIVVTTEAPIVITTEDPIVVTTESPIVSTVVTTEAPTTINHDTEGTTTEPEVTTLDPNNPCEPTGVYAIPVENDCSAYVQCFNGLAIPSTCAPGLQFDPILAKCNKEELVNCTVSSTEGPVTTTTESPICPVDGVYNVPFDSEYCSGFYILCAEFVPVLMECAPGLLYDPIAATCMRSEDVDCVPATTLAPEVTTSYPTTIYPIIQCDKDGIYTIPIENSNCTQYILCVNREPVEQTCAPGTLYSFEQGKCVREEGYVCPGSGVTTGPVTTENSNLYPCPDTGFVYLPHPESCSKFYMCSDGEFRGIYTCGANGLWFDSVIQGCVEPEESDCKLEPIPDF